MSPISSSWGDLEVQAWAGHILCWEQLGWDPSLWMCFWVFHHDCSSHPLWGQDAAGSADEFHLSPMVCPPITRDVWLPTGIHSSASLGIFLSPCQRLRLSIVWWLQIKLTLISENIDQNSNVILNMDCISLTGFYVKGRRGQHLTLAACSKWVPNTLNNFSLTHTI